MTTPQQLTLEKQALTTFRETIKTILIGLQKADQHMTETLPPAVVIVNQPDGGDDAVTNVLDYYKGRATDTHGNVKAVVNSLTQIMNSADQILKFYNTAGQSEEISVDQVKGVFNAALAGGGVQQPPGGVQTPGATQ